MLRYVPALLVRVLPFAGAAVLAAGLIGALLALAFTPTSVLHHLVN